jgi:hypothetical protein
MANLQERLDKAFGALNSITDQPAWKPSAQQIFRSGAPPDDVAASSDEEYEEKQRRESVPGKCSRLERLQGVIGVCLGWWEVGGRWRRAGHRATRPAGPAAATRHLPLLCGGSSHPSLLALQA